MKYLVIATQVTRIFCRS